ncbi:hypothetical protein EXIGLDRAFT_723109, partial [Exidia glandulosa HHB12029]
MPDFTDAGGDDIWQYASDVYASMTKGDAYFAKGESLRPGNVWEVYVGSTSFISRYPVARVLNAL